MSEDETGALPDREPTLTETGALPDPEPALTRTIEALLFLAPDPLSPRELADAAAAEELDVVAALTQLAERYAPGRSGIHLRELGGGFTFASDPLSEEAAKRLFSRPRASTLTPAQTFSGQSSAFASERSRFDRFVSSW